MKKLLSLVIALLMVSSILVSCTENLINEDDQTILETQAIDKDDVTPPGGGGEEDPDDTEG